MQHPTNNQNFEIYQEEDEDLDAPECFYYIYIYTQRETERETERQRERNCFDLLQVSVENDHEIGNDNDLDQAEGNFQEKAQNMQNNLANEETVN